MADPWYIDKWASAIVLLVYLVVQVVAMRRLDGDRKKRSQSILLGMVVLEGRKPRGSQGWRSVRRAGCTCCDRRSEPNVARSAAAFRAVTEEWQ
jgi:hypothetical protein